MQGIKGQYLIFDTGVINVRKFTSYEVEVSAYVTRDISRSMTSVRETSLQTLNGSREISQVTDSQAQLAGELQALAQGFRVA